MTSSTHQKAKGPAEAATSPSHGSTNPQKDTEMNEATNTTALPLAARDAAVASAMRDLEGDVHDLMHMARISADIAERLMNRPHSTRTEDGLLLFAFGAEERDGLIFSISDVETRVKSLKRRYMAAFNGEVVQ